MIHLRWSREHEIATWPQYPVHFYEVRPICTQSKLKHELGIKVTGDARRHEHMRETEREG
jgi:hypothetical protein